MPVRKLKQFLDERGVKYVSIDHSRAYTAQEVAASAHIPGRELAKTVMVKLDGEVAMAVLPASYEVDFSALEEVSGANGAELASEGEFRDLFPECETGAMPPFGNLWEIPIYADASLTDDEEIAFEGGSHTELIRLAWDDYVRLAEPEVGSFAVKRE